MQRVVEVAVLTETYQMLNQKEKHLVLLYLSIPNTIHAFHVLKSL